MTGGVGTAMMNILEVISSLAQRYGSFLDRHRDLSTSFNFSFMESLPSSIEGTRSLTSLAGSSFLAQVGWTLQ